MRGNPLLRVIAVLAILLAVLAPLRSLTMPAPNSVPKQPAPASTVSLSVQVELTSTSVPFTYEVMHLGKAVFSGNSTVPQVKQNIEVAFPKEGIDLVVHVSWNDKQPSALKAIVTPDTQQPITRVIWGEGAADEVLTFAY